MSSHSVTASPLGHQVRWKGMCDNNLSLKVSLPTQGLRIFDTALRGHRSEIFIWHFLAGRRSPAAFSVIFGWSPGARFISCLFAKLLISSSSDYRKNCVPGSCFKFCSQFTVITRSSPYPFSAMPALVARQESSLHSSDPSSASSPS